MNAEGQGNCFQHLCEGVLNCSSQGSALHYLSTFSCEVQNWTTNYLESQNLQYLTFILLYSCIFLNTVPKVRSNSSLTYSPGLNEIWHYEVSSDLPSTWQTHLRKHKFTVPPRLIAQQTGSFWWIYLNCTQ